MAPMIKADSVTVDARQMTGRDWRDIGRAIESPVTQAMMSNPPIEVVYAMLWITLRRDDPKLTYDDVLDIPIADLPQMGGGTDPKGPRALAPVAATS